MPPVEAPSVEAGPALGWGSIPSPATYGTPPPAAGTPPPSGSTPAPAPTPTPTPTPAPVSFGPSAPDHSDPGTRPPSVGFPRRRRILLAAAVVALLAVAAGVALFLRSGDTGGLTAPEALSASPAADGVQLRWSAPSGGTADHYVVQRDGQEVTSAVHGTSFVDRPNDHADHSYTVAAVGARGETSASSKPTKGAIDSQAFTQGERDLIARLPRGVVDRSGCRPDVPDEDQYTDAAVTCRAVPAPAGSATATPTDVVALHDRSPSLLRQDVADQIQHSSAPENNCATPPGHNIWHFPNVTQTAGQIVCFTGPGGTSYLLWSYESDGSTPIALRIDTTQPYPFLLRYWETVDLQLS